MRGDKLILFNKIRYCGDENAEEAYQWLVDNYKILYKFYNSGLTHEIWEKRHLSYINIAFTWRNTPQGFWYWKNIAEACDNKGKK